MDWLTEHEPLFRLGCFFGVLTLMLFWETLRPLRKSSLQTGVLSHRRISNVGLSAINTLLLRFLPGIAAIQAAIWAEGSSSGLIPALALDGVWGILVAIVLMDLVIYFQHRVFHAVPWLWRLHRMHHSDRHFDTTTAIRFHPIEIVLSMLIKFTTVLLLGAPVVAVILFEVILNASALFNHGNVSLGKGLDRWLRRLIVTPDMHRVHHSTLPYETDSNFGFCFSVWDRLFATYIPQPRRGHQGMTIGLDEFQDTRSDQLLALLIQPFRNVKDSLPAKPPEPSDHPQ